ncbi:MAG: hypothetical protein SGJ20_18155 [Planctomycetota bacterium]|nr:hypothetical protein [Planctomycetota bacterium]
MATQVEPDTIDLKSPFQPLLSGLRRRIQSYIWFQGIALALGWLFLAFWISLALDWMIEPPPVVRGIALVAVAGVFVWIVYHYILARIAVPLTDANMAVLLERRYRGFRDGLLTSVELGERSENSDSTSTQRGGTSGACYGTELFNLQMLTHTRDEALRESAQVRVGEVFQNRTLARAVVIAILLAASVVVFAVLAPSAFQTWTQRVILLSQELWPRKTRLSMVGFENGVMKVARGGDFRVVAQADRKFVVPEDVQIRFRTDDENSGREIMHQDSAGPGDPFQPFFHVFPGILSSHTFDVLGGDDRIRDLRIEVVDNPTVAEMTLYCEYPAYMHRSPRELRVTGLMQLPMGTKIRIQAKSNKPLQRVKIERVLDESIEAIETIDKFAGQDQREFSVQLEPLSEDVRLQFMLLDTDNILGRDPVRLDLTPVPDDSPKINLQMLGVSSAVTPNARLPLSGEIVDDYGIGPIWIEYQLGDAAVATQPFSRQANGGDVMKFDRATPEAFDLKDLSTLPRLLSTAVSIGKPAPADVTGSPADTSDDAAPSSTAPPASTPPESTPSESTPPTGEVVASAPPRELPPLVIEPGQRLALLVKAEDLSTLKALPNVGLGVRYVIDIVTPDQLLAMLEARELLLRQKFETIIEELTATRDLLARLEVAGDKQNRPETSEAVKDQEGFEPGDELPKASKSANDGKSSKTETDQVTAEQRTSLMLSLERCADNIERSGFETGKVGEGFLEIREEIENNRIDNPATLRRLKDEIADPLLAISVGRFPDLKKRMAELQKVAMDPNAAPQAQTAAINEATKILADMQTILDKVIEMATINELADKLRKLIEEQKDLNSETKRQQIRSLRSLTE